MNPDYFPNKHKLDLAQHAAGPNGDVVAEYIKLGGWYRGPVSDVVWKDVDKVSEEKPKKKAKKK